MSKNIPILNLFNEVEDKFIQWCTPSIHLDVPKVKNIYSNDISCSYHSAGSLSSNNGIFKEAHDLASKAYGADKTIFSVNGSTGSNFTVFRALKKQLSHIKLLSARNVHKSIGVAIEDYDVDITYLPIRYDDDLQIFLLNFEKDILKEIKKQKPNVLLLTNPSYEGLSLDLKSLITKIRRINKNLIIFVDEAWGSHFNFSDFMPESAMSAGADICVQSTHKQGSALQQTSMIHWKEERISSDFIYEANMEIATTSPSYHLLASLDAARYLMENKGEKIIAKFVGLSNILRHLLNTIPGVHAYYAWELKEKFNLDCDPIKILVNLRDKSAIILCEILEKKYNIVVEKYEASNFILIMKFQNGLEEIDKTVEAIEMELKNLNCNDIKFPRFPCSINKAKKISDLQKSEVVGLEKTEGRICAENIIPYPPGIPLVAKGEFIQKEHIEYLLALRETKGLITVLMADESLGSIKVERVAKK